MPARRRAVDGMRESMRAWSRARYSVGPGCRAAFVGLSQDLVEFVVPRLIELCVPPSIHLTAA